MSYVQLFEEFSDSMSLNETTRKDAVRDFVDKELVTKQHFKDLQEQDPSRQGDKPGKLLYWITKAVANGNSADEVLELADWIFKNESRLKRSGINTDIYSKNSGLYSYEGACELQYSMGESKSKSKAAIKTGDVKGAEILFDEGGIKLVKVVTREAMIHFANYFELEKCGNTQWCVAMEKTADYWNSYASTSEFIILINPKNPNPLKKIAIQKPQKGGAMWWASNDLKLDAHRVIAQCEELPSSAREILANIKLIPKPKKTLVGNLHQLVLDGNLDNILEAVNVMAMGNILKSEKLNKLLKDGWYLKSTVRQLNNGNMGFWASEHRRERELTINTANWTVEVRFGAGARRYKMQTNPTDLQAFYEEAFDYINEQLVREDPMIRSRDSIAKENDRVGKKNELVEILRTLCEENMKLANFQQNIKSDRFCGGLNNAEIKTIISFVKKINLLKKAAVFADNISGISSKDCNATGDVFMIPDFNTLTISNDQTDIPKVNDRLCPSVLAKSFNFAPIHGEGRVSFKNAALTENDLVGMLNGSSINTLWFHKCLLIGNIDFNKLNLGSKCIINIEDSVISENAIITLRDDDNLNAIVLLQPSNFTVKGGRILNLRVSNPHNTAISNVVVDSNVKLVLGWGINGNTPIQAKCFNITKDSKTNESKVIDKHHMKYIQTFAAFEAALLRSSNETKTNEAVLLLVTELTNSELNEGEVWDEMVNKLKQVGHNVARNVVMLAMVASAFQGIPAEAAAAIHMASGVNVEQSAHPDMTVTQATEAMKKLEERFYTGEGAQGQVFLKFSGDIKDVVGVEPINGYPIFKKGSASALAFHQAFDQHKILKGVVDVHGKKVEGDFVVSSGLYYPIIQPELVKAVLDEPALAAPTSAPAAHDVAPGKMIDFSGILGQSAQMFQEMHGKINGKELDRVEFTWAVIRKTFPSLAKVTNDQFEEAFDVHGKFSPKIEVSKLGVDVGQDLQKMIAH